MTNVNTNAINVLDETVATAKNEDISLRDYQGQVLLIVNVASKCGLTPQYSALEALYKKYQTRGFMVLGFPCNQFAGQEPGTMEEILIFCSAKYDVTFPIFHKLDVNGETRAPLYQKLVQMPPTGDIGWNFEKFLVGRDGNVLARFSAQTKPDSLEVVAAIEQALG